MTSIAAYIQYQCKQCGQIHVKPEFVSISIFVPADAIFKSTDMKACKRCGVSQQVQEYEKIDRLAECIEVDTYPERPSWWLKLRRRLDQKYGMKDVSVINLYPRI